MAFLERISRFVILLEGWRAGLLAVLAGAASGLALAPYHFSPILLVTFPLLVWLLDGAVAPSHTKGLFARLARFAPAFWRGWAFGFGYFLATFWWIGIAFLVDAEEFIYLLPLAVVALPAGLALFWGFAAAVARLAWGNGWSRLVMLAACLTLAEWLRGTVFTGLPWNNPGYALMPTPVLMQSAGLIGLYGMTFVTVLIASTPAVFAQPTMAGSTRRWPMVLATLVLATAHVGYGAFILAGAKTEFVDDVRLRLVQPAIAQGEKWQPENEAEMMGRYLGLSNADKGPQAASVDAFTHIIWPESAFPFILTQRKDQLAAIAKLLPPQATLITGAMRLEPPAEEGHVPRVFNALYAINTQGEIIAARDKIHLVPFGEYLPFQPVLEAIGLRQLTQLRGGFSQGNRRTVVKLANTPAFLPLICYEIIFSGRLMDRSGATDDGGDTRPKWIVNLTNDAWFGQTAGPYQHAHQAQVRGVEEGLPVVRAANNGISFVTDPYGRMLESLALGQRGVVDAYLPQAISPPLFARTGNTPVLIFVCLLIIVLVGLRRFGNVRL